MMNIIEGEITLGTYGHTQDPVGSNHGYSDIVRYHGNCLFHIEHGYDILYDCYGNQLTNLKQRKHRIRIINFTVT